MKTTPKPRRKRSDSASAAVQAAQNAALGPLNPPAHIKIAAEVRPFWDAIMANRPRHLWNDADLAHAAVLARAQCDVEKLQCDIAKEGHIVRGKENPKHKLAETLARRAVSVARLLHVHAEATVGRSRDSVKAAELERTATTARVEHDPLIPRLRAVK